MDNKPPFNDSCEDMKSLMAVYTILYVLWLMYNSEVKS